MDETYKNGWFLRSLALGLLSLEKVQHCLMKSLQSSDKISGISGHFFYKMLKASSVKVLQSGLFKILLFNYVSTKDVFQ